MDHQKLLSNKTFSFKDMEVDSLDGNVNIERTTYLLGKEEKNESILICHIKYWSVGGKIRTRMEEILSLARNAGV